MDLFFNTKLRGRRVYVIPWMTLMDRYYFMVATGESDSKYSAFHLGSDAETIFKGIDALFPGFSSIEDVYASPVLETTDEVVVWVRVRYLEVPPQGTRKVTLRNLKALVKESIPGLDPRIRSVLTRSSQEGSKISTRIGGVRKGLQTLVGMRGPR